MKTILKHLIAIAFLPLIPVVALCCEKESPLFFEDSERVSDIDGSVYKIIKMVEQDWITENLNVSHIMNWDLIREAKAREEWEPARIEYEPARSYKNIDSENREKTRKQDYLYLVNDPIGFDVFLFVLFVITGSFFIVNGIMTYKIIYGNLVTNLKEEQ